jgi:hypothetical protein
MKNLLKIVSVLFIAILTVVSCDNQETNETELNSTNRKSELYSESEVLKVLNNNSAEVECKGSCSDCTMIVSLVTGIGQCGCVDCTLVISTKQSNGNINEDIKDKEKLIQSLYNLDFFKSSYTRFLEYSEKKYGVKAIKSEGIEFYSNDDVIAVLFKFKDSKGELQSVMYSQTINEEGKVLGPKFEIDCTGSCGCKEQFNFNNGTASCSCTDCVMTVTQV